MPYENEILKELEEGKTYSEGEIYDLMYNRDVIVISETCKHFNAISTRKFTVLKKCIGYVHECNNEGLYCVPSTTRTLYLVD